jgi:hypothetical protein
MLAFILAGAQFSHAHELNSDLGAKHVHAHSHATNAHSHSTDLADSEPSSGIHCGAHLLPLVAEYTLAPFIAEPSYTRLLQLFTLEDQPGFDTPPPRA